MLPTDNVCRHLIVSSPVVRQRRSARADSSVDNPADGDPWPAHSGFSFARHSAAVSGLPRAS
jgi:hypothetical protein